jgi:hypothetical protein
MLLVSLSSHKTSTFVMITVVSLEECGRMISLSCCSPKFFDVMSIQSWCTGVRLLPPGEDPIAVRNNNNNNNKK